MGGVGEVAGAGDRERRADLVRAVCPGSARRARSPPRARAGCRGRRSRRRSAPMSMPRPKWWLETEPPAVNLSWSEHMHVTVILCSWLSLVSTATTRGSIRPALMSAMPSESKHDVLVVQQRERLGAGRRRPCPRRRTASGRSARDGGGRGRLAACATTCAGRSGRRRRRGRVALDADEHDVRAARSDAGRVDRVGVVALQRGELAVLDVAVEEPDVAVGAEVVLAAPVVGDDVSGPRVLGADDLEAVVALLGVAHPGLRRPAQPPPGILCPACSSDQVMNDAHHGLPGRDLRRGEVLLDLRAAVRAAGLARRRCWVWAMLQRRGAERAPAAAGRSDGRRGSRPRPAAAARRGAAGRLLSRPWASASLVW